MRSRCSGVSFANPASIASRVTAVISRIASSIVSKAARAAASS